MAHPQQQPPHQSGHDWKQLACEPADDEDLVEQMIKKTGCLQHHYTVAECMAEHMDWRKCQTEVTAFRECMNVYYKSRGADPSKPPTHSA